MLHLCISNYELKILHNHKKMLEARYKVKLRMPDFVNDCPTDEIIVVTIKGTTKSIGCVQRFLEKKSAKRKCQEQDNDQSVVVLNSSSEDESDKDIVTLNNSSEPMNKRQRTENPEIDLDSTIDLVPCDVSSENNASVCEVSSTTNPDESVIIVDSLPAEDFIPICQNKRSKNLSISIVSPAQEDDIVLIDISDDKEDATHHTNQSLTVPKPIATRRLRPVVIDGSNVARSHGKPTNTFSSKGIKICVDYFLERGHPQVTAFVPLFRRHCKNGIIKTTDQNILEELEKTQNVVFTPSRKIDGKSYSCYDDRFIVELAAKNGGVILSNDNYRDLIDESPAFTETIKSRLLMYCFVGDMLMIPADPLGSRGPKLDEYLSFPPDE